MSQRRPHGQLKWLAVLLLIALLGAGIGCAAWFAAAEDGVEEPALVHLSPSAASQLDGFALTPRWNLTKVGPWTP